MRTTRGSQSSKSQRVVRIPPGRRWATGVNMVELMMVILIISILFGIGIPSFRYVTNSNRVAMEVNGLLGSMQYARSEAIKQGLTVSICAADNVTAATAACAATNHWEGGWVVFVDVNNSGTIDNAGDTVLKVQAPFSSATDTLVADNDTQKVTFNREGFATGMPADGGVVTVTLHTNPVNDAWTRCLQINTVGNMNSEKATEGACQ